MPALHVFYDLFPCINPPSNPHAWGANPPCCYVSYRFLLAAYLAWMSFQDSTCGSASTSHMHAQSLSVRAASFILPIPYRGSIEASVSSPWPDLIAPAAGEGGSRLGLMASILLSVEGHSLKHSSPLGSCTHTSTKCWRATGPGEAN